MSMMDLKEELISKLSEYNNAVLKSKLERISERLSQLTCTDIIEEYKDGVLIDEEVEYNKSLDMIQSLKEFNGDTKSYIAWRVKADNCMSAYTKDTAMYNDALSAFRKKIIGEANKVLKNDNIVLDYDAIITRLDRSYIDKKPLDVLIKELNEVRQGNMCIKDYYNEIKAKLIPLIKKLDVLHGTNTELAIALNKKYQNYALNIFIAGLNPPVSQVLFSLYPTDLSVALVKAREIEYLQKGKQYFEQAKKPTNTNKVNKLKRRRPKTKFGLAAIPKKEGEQLQIDIFYVDEYQFMSCVDIYSKYLVVNYIEHNLNICMNILQLFFNFPNVRQIIVDNDPYFTSTEFKTLMKRNKVKIYFCDPTRGMIGSQVKRIHSTLIDMARTMKLETNLVDDIEVIIRAAFEYNKTINAVTKMKPIDILFNQLPHDDIGEKLKSTREHMMAKKLRNKN